MRNLLNFLARYNNLIIFILLEGLSFYFLASRNTYHNTRIVFGVRGITYRVEERMSHIRSFLHLRDINRNLAEENIALKNRMERMIKEDKSYFSTVTDSVHKQQYTHTSAEVIDNSVDHQKNFFLVNKGKRQGVEVNMAVTTPNGVAGVIVGCSENLSIAMSLLNIDFRISGRIKSNGYFGSVNWDGRNYRRAILSEIPQHVPVVVGDTIETTGYSAVFPEGVMIGTVSDFKKIGGDFYKITVSLSANFKNLRYVDIIGNKRRTEMQDLQKLFK
jgi:rod shape-determining protein MreC